MTPRKQPVLVSLQTAAPKSQFFHLDRSDLDYIVEKLNERPGGEPGLYAEALIRLMERLKGCGGNLKKMMDEDPELEKVVRTSCTTVWLPSKTGRAHLALQPSKEIKNLPPMPEPQDAEKRAQLLAALWFHVGTLNPEWNKLAGPCARCGNYYIKKRASQKVYCSRRCGNAATAVERTRERIASERGDKLDRAKAAIKKWKSTATRQDWKLWVSKKTGIDPRFLTRAITKGDLVPPTKGR
jgi:hypothetical protein